VGIPVRALLLDQRFRVESISASFFIADEQSGQVFGLLWHGHPVRLLDGQ
jgi:hypothetical protein